MWMGLVEENESTQPQAVKSPYQVLKPIGFSSAFKIKTYELWPKVFLKDKDDPI